MDLPELNEYLKSVIDLIPAHSYFKQPQSENNNNNKNKKSRKKKSDKTEQDTRKKLAKKRKLQPAFMKTTSAQITDQNGADNDEVTEGTQKRKKWAEGGDKESPSLTVLQKRMRDKLAEIQAQRNPKNRSPEEIERIRAKRKKERVKLKSKRHMKQLHMSNNVSAEMQGKPGQIVSKSDSKNSGSIPENSEGKAVFSKFDFGKEIGPKKKKKVIKNKTRTLLAQAESKKEKLETLKTTNPEEAESKIKHESWGKALAKAGGTKIKDDPELLKKSLKKERAIKRQHAKKWQEREKNVQEKMQQRQEKRSRNIEARKGQVKDRKKEKRAKKFAKSVPGF